MSRRTRTRVAKGIYRDEYGLAGVVKVGIAQRVHYWRGYIAESRALRGGEKGVG